MGLHTSRPRMAKGELRQPVTAPPALCDRPSLPRQGHWDVVDFLESHTGVHPKSQTSAGEVIAPFDPSTPLEADVFGQKYAGVLDVADPLSAEQDVGLEQRARVQGRDHLAVDASGLPVDASGLARPGEAGWPQEEYERQQARWRQAVANRPEHLAVEGWIEQHPHSHLAQRVACQPGLPSEWRRQISGHIEWLRAQGIEAAQAAEAVYEAGQKRQEEKERQRVALLSQVPDDQETLSMSGAAVRVF